MHSLPCREKKSPLFSRIEDNSHMNKLKTLAFRSLGFLTLALGLALSVPAGAQTQGTAGFEKHFELKRDTAGTLVKVSFRNPGFSVQSLADSTEQDLAEVFDEILNEDLLAGDDEWLTSLELGARDSSRVQKALLQLQKLYRSPEWQKIWKGEKMQALIQKLDRDLQANAAGLTLIAHLTDSHYFYKRAVIHLIVKGAVRFAGKLFLGNVPGLAVGSFLAARVSQMLRERQLYFQYLALGYLERFEPQALGLTEMEAAHIRSSIYESQIPWFDLLESKRAALSWDVYGERKFKSERSRSDWRLEQHRAKYFELKDRLGFSMHDVVRQGSARESLVVNLAVSRSLLKPEPAPAWRPEKAGSIRRERLILKAAELGSYFLPIPSLVRMGLERVLRSFYINQIPYEGGLYAHFAVLNPTTVVSEDQKQLARQSTNILISRALSK